MPYYHDGASAQFVRGLGIGGGVAIQMPKLFCKSVRQDDESARLSMGGSAYIIVVIADDMFWRRFLTGF